MMVRSRPTIPGQSVRRVAPLVTCARTKRLLIVLALAIAQIVCVLPQQAAAAQNPGKYAQVKGKWFRHDFSLRVTPGGLAVAVYRSGVWCAKGQRFGCDRIVGNLIYDGGLWVSQLQMVSRTTAIGTIGASADPSLDGTRIKLVRQPHDFILLTWGGARHRMQTTFCGPKSPPINNCGA
jgi:hypothetical protein